MLMFVSYFAKPINTSEDDILRPTIRVIRIGMSILIRRSCAGAVLPSGMRRAAAASLATSSSTVPSSVASVVVVQRRTQYMQAPGKRDQEAFLSQYEPLDVLNLDETCSAKEVHAAYNRLVAKYGPQGPSPDPKMVDRVTGAYEVLKDPMSPYYIRAHATDNHRKRLQFDMLPEKQRKAVQFQVVIAAIFVACVGGLIVFMSLQPMKKVRHAATR